MDRPDRITAISLSIVLMTIVCTSACLALDEWPASARASRTDADDAATVVKILTLEAVEPHGNTRTSLEVIERYLGLTPGMPIDQADLLAAVARLRDSDLFDAVDYYTRPGETRGTLVLVLEVEERGPDVRFGTGNSDLDGWYLIPAALSLDNLTGRGEQAALQLMFGYRTVGLSMYYRRGTAPADRTFWGAEFRITGNERVYFVDGVEYGHPVARGGLNLQLGRRLGGAWSLSTTSGGAPGAATAAAGWWRAAAGGGAGVGGGALSGAPPAGIAADVGERERTTWRTDLVLDTRSAMRRAGSPTSGLWGRLRLGYTFQEQGDFPSASCDLRTYRPLGAGVLGLHGRAAYVGEDAPFYDRLYLGGLYTVRGFPSQSLTAPAGDEWLCNGSLEFRAPLLGDAARPRVAGVLFLDAGQGGDVDGSSGDVAVGIGWGFRVRLGWLGYLGTDIAVPLTDSPVDESFHGHASLGWSF